MFVIGFVTIVALKWHNFPKILEHYWLKEKRWPKDKDGNCIPGLAVHTGNKRVYWAKRYGYTHIEGYYVKSKEEQAAIVKQTFMLKEAYPNV